MRSTCSIMGSFEESLVTLVDDLSAADYSKKRPGSCLAAATLSNREPVISNLGIAPDSTVSDGFK